MPAENLQTLLDRAKSPVELLRNSQIGPYAFPVVRPEFTNWRDEQRAWRETCALFDQSHHMTDLYVEGPDALKLLSDLGINSFKNFRVDQAKQFASALIIVTHNPSIGEHTDRTLVLRNGHLEEHKAVPIEVVKELAA